MAFVALGTLVAHLGKVGWMRGLLLVVLAALVIWTSPNRWGAGIALHYLSRVYWPDPADPIPPRRKANSGVCGR